MILASTTDGTTTYREFESLADMMDWLVSNTTFIDDE